MGTVVGMAKCLLGKLLKLLGNIALNGGGDRNRTRDILLAKQALYQLSYAPIYGIGAYR